MTMMDGVAQVAHIINQRNEARQALWDIYIALGFDADHETLAPRPGVMAPDLPELVLNAAKEFRKDYDDACEEVWVASLH